MSASPRDVVEQRVSRYGPLPDPTPADGPDPYGDPDPDWLRIDWRLHLHDVEFGGARVHYAEMGPPIVRAASARDRVRPRTLGLLAELAGEHPSPRSPPPGRGPRPARVRLLARARRGRSRSRPTADSCSTSATRSASATRGVVGNSMGGFVSAEAVDRGSPDRFEKLVLVSAAGVSSVRLRRQPTEVVARMVAAGDATGVRAFRPAPSAAGAPATLALGGIFHSPGSCGRSSSGSSSDGGHRAQAFVEALAALAGYDILDRLAGGRGPDADRLGGPGPRRPPGRRARLRAASAELAARGLRRDAATSRWPSARSGSTGSSSASWPSPNERPEYPRRAHTAGRSWSCQPVIAPRLAEPTERAYLASTPVAYAGSGGS